MAIEIFLDGHGGMCTENQQKVDPDITFCVLPVTFKFIVYTPIHSETRSQIVFDILGNNVKYYDLEINQRIDKINQQECLSGDTKINATMLNGKFFNHVLYQTEDPIGDGDEFLEPVMNDSLLIRAKKFANSISNFIVLDYDSLIYDHEVCAKCTSGENQFFNGILLSDIIEFCKKEYAEQKEVIIHWLVCRTTPEDLLKHESQKYQDVSKITTQLAKDYSNDKINSLHDFLLGLITELQKLSKKYPIHSHWFYSILRKFEYYCVYNMSRTELIPNRQWNKAKKLIMVLQETVSKLDTIKKEEVNNTNLKREVDSILLKIDQFIKLLEQL